MHNIPELFQLEPPSHPPSSPSPSPSPPPSLASPSTSTSRTLSSTSYFDRPVGLNQSTSLRQGRPTIPQRQSSFSKRHASFDTPREVPFSAEHPKDALKVHRTSFSRNSSGSTIGAVERPQSPSYPPHGVVHSNHPDHVPLYNAVGKPHGGSHNAGSGSGSSSSLGRLPSPMLPPDGAPAVSDNPMVYKYDKESSGSPPCARTTTESNNRDQRNAGIWDSSHLRPHLLSSPPKGKGHDYQVPSDHHQSLPAPYSPYLLQQQEQDGIHSPSPLRPSSTLSLPLPSQMPFFALPSTSMAGQKLGNTTLSRVTEQVPSSFDSQSDSTGLSGSDSSPSSISSSDPMSLQRRASSPPSNPLSALFRSADRHGHVFGHASAAASSNSMVSSNSAPSITSSVSSSLPPPTPPTVHTPPPPPYSSPPEVEDGKSVESEGKRRSAPYEPFLSHAPPPADTYISVETTDAEYRLIVRLPGYRQDCIMLSTRRRRILHIAADSWEAGGGHFERRISFGYDADLTRVRAEFDGEHLRVLVPRKASPILWFAGPEAAA